MTAKSPPPLVTSVCVRLSPSLLATLDALVISARRDDPTCNRSRTDILRGLIRAAGAVQ